MLFNMVPEKEIKNIEDQKINLAKMDVLLAYTDYIEIKENSRYVVIKTTKKLLESYWNDVDHGIREKLTEN